MLLASIVVVAVRVVVDQIKQVLVHVAVDLQSLKVFGVAFQREHQQPHGCECVGVHGVIAGRSLLRSRTMR